MVTSFFPWHYERVEYLVKCLYISGPTVLVATLIYFLLLPQQSRLGMNNEIYIIQTPSFQLGSFEFSNALMKIQA